MLFGKRLKRQETGKDPYPELAKRLSEIEKRLERLQEDLRGGTLVVIEHAEKVNVEKMDYSNHFGTLEIDNLQGQLNIGRNHHLGTLPSAKLLAMMKKAAALRAKSGEGGKSGPPGGEPAAGAPRYNLQPRREGKPGGGPSRPPT